MCHLWARHVHKSRVPTLRNWRPTSYDTLGGASLGFPPSHLSDFVPEFFCIFSIADVLNCCGAPVTPVELSCGKSVVSIATITDTKYAATNCTRAVHSTPKTCVFAMNAFIDRAVYAVGGILENIYSLLSEVCLWEDFTLAPY